MPATPSRRPSRAAASCPARWRSVQSDSDRRGMSSRQKTPATALVPLPPQPARRSARTPRSIEARTVAASGCRLSWHGIACFTVVFIAVWAPAANAAAQTLQHGMNTRVLTPQIGDKMRELGATLVRLPYGWDVIEPACKGCFDWTTTDAWRDEAKRSRLTIFGSLAYAPRWANGGHPFNYPPLVLQDWYDFVFATV